MDFIDDLSYFYAPLSNQLMKVGDTAFEEGFKNGTNSGDDYAYDLNGNLVMDKKQGNREHLLQLPEPATIHCTLLPAYGGG